MIKNKPELLSPAGGWSSLHTAVNSGADSVYFGIRGMNMRSLASNFDILEIKKVMTYLHKFQKKGYLVLNTIVMNQELKRVEKILKEAKRAGVDAVILWDMAVLEMAKYLGLPIHISTQASISNFKALMLYRNLGAKRAVLARELSLDEIEAIIKKSKKESMDIEIETFIHGAMCISVSGRCLLSQYSFGKSANRGQCLQPCRREYRIIDKDNEAEYDLGEDYILSAKDLCSIDFLDVLIEAGIHSFKIEGRMRSPDYVQVTTSVYRRAIDAYFRNELTDQYKHALKIELAKVFNRGFSNGFYFGPPQNAISRRLDNTYEKLYLGNVKKFYKKINVADIRLQHGSLSKGEQILVMGRSTPAQITTADEIQNDHIYIEKAEKGTSVGVKLPFMVKPNDKVFLWRKKREESAVLMNIEMI